MLLAGLSMARNAHILVHLHLQAPAKPALGAACNGCGACCALETCPAARLFLRQSNGPCRALLWQEMSARYACGMALTPRRFLRWLPAWSEALAQRFFARGIAAGSGCDADIEVGEARSEGGEEHAC